MLDGTHVRVRVPPSMQIPYRGRKGIVTVNVLAACDPDVLFTYVLSGWEGSSADSRVLSNALARRNGLRVTEGKLLLHKHEHKFQHTYNRLFECLW